MPLKQSTRNDALRSKISRDHSLPTISRSLILLDIEDALTREFLSKTALALDFTLVMATGTVEENFLQVSLRVKSDTETVCCQY